MSRFWLKITVVAVLAAVLVVVITVGLLRPRQTEQVSRLPDTAPMLNAERGDAEGPALEQARYDSKMPGPAFMAVQATQPGESSAEQQQRAIRDYYLAEDGVVPSPSGDFVPQRPGPPLPPSARQHGRRFLVPDLQVGATSPATAASSLV
jgi:hypothetical protein